MSDALDKLEASMQQQRVATINNTAAVLKSGMRVLTTSLSSTVAKAISQAHQQALSEAAAAAGTPGDSSAAADADATAQPQPATQQAPATTPAAAGRDAGAAQEQQQQGTQQQPAVLPGTVAQQDPADDLDDDRNYFPPSSGIGWEPYSSSLPPWLLGGPSSAGGSSSSFKGSSRGPGLSVIVCESRPLCEGVAMAQRLAAAGLQVTAITDAQAGVFVEEADVVLLGADAVTPAGVVNKVGSKLLALAAKAASVPVVAVTDSLKITPGPVSEFALPNTVLQVRRDKSSKEEEGRGEQGAWMDSCVFVSWCVCGGGGAYRKEACVLSVWSCDSSRTLLAQPPTPSPGCCCLFLLSPLLVAGGRGGEGCV